MRKGSKISDDFSEADLCTAVTLRKDIFRKLLDHLKAGLSVDCFKFLSFHSIQRCLREYPAEFVQSKYDQALREGQDMWEDIGKAQALGKCLGNSKSWYYNMANRYGWRERVDLQSEHKGAMQVEIVNYTRAKDSASGTERGS